MKMQIKSSKKQLLAAMSSSDISRRIDKMDLYSEMQVITLDAAKKAANGGSRNNSPGSAIHVKTYVTQRSGMYGYQFMTCVWISIDGQWFHASGSLTGGCGYDKISSAIGSAFRALGLTSDLVPYIDGTGQHEEFVYALAKKLLGQKRFIIV